MSKNAIKVMKAKELIKFIFKFNEIGIGEISNIYRRLFQQDYIQLQL